MGDAVLLDSGPLGKMVHQQSTFEDEIQALESYAKNKGISLLVPEIIERELSGELSRCGFIKSLRKLNKMRNQGRIINLIEPDDYDIATILETELALTGSPISINIPSNDGILVAQAIHLKASQQYNRVIILTENVRHISKLLTKEIYIWDYKQAISDCDENSEMNLIPPIK
ncbi:MAG: hypothetical protein N5P05_003899 [Chroococcopsis gigantea SAG 12.99]|jgi:hypothetical protein|nr:hypothetical protein [Chlorogloea purpurea SAG 13.99]MDV3002293.1 hypothetical protein [Chroococcopsis gigantea SAG 12.99]